jgi:hypothetical protein
MMLELSICCLRSSEWFSRASGLGLTPAHVISYQQLREAFKSEYDTLGQAHVSSKLQSTSCKVFWCL